MKSHAAVVGLGFGDEGKGGVTDFLTSRHSPYGPGHFGTVVRFNGGAQAGHRVVTASALPKAHVGGGGGAHVFSQFGSGYFNGCMTHLSKFSLVDPLALVAEAEALDKMWVGQAFRRLTIDRHALLVTPFHAAANKAREVARGTDRHGSCGMGIGETMAYFLQQGDEAPRVGDVQDRRLLRRKLWGLHDFYQGLVPTEDMPPIEDLIEVYRMFANWTKIVDEYYLPTLLDHQNVLFEGAQGVLLDEDVGFHPYTTWSKTTFANVIELTEGHEFERFGVTRTYSTRHGAGPFPTEDPEWSARLPDPSNVLGEWQGNFRVGPLDLVLMRYAAEAVGGLDQVAVTHMGEIGEAPFLCKKYERPADSQNGPIITALTPPKVAKERGYQQRLSELLMTVTPVLEPLYDQVVDEVEMAVGAPVTILGYGPKAENKVQRSRERFDDGQAARPQHEAVGALVPA